MPYVLSGIVSLEWPGLWGEGHPYERTSLIDITANDPKLPPVNYDLHQLKPHSIPHVDLPKHVLADGQTLESYFSGPGASSFFGPVTVLSLSNGEWEKKGDNKVWRVTRERLELEVERLGKRPNKLFVTPSEAPTAAAGYHDPTWVFVLTAEAAEYLVENPQFNAFGTSWKSSDFEPGSRERPVHKLLLQQAVLYECLKLHHVPAGEYFLSGFPLALAGASESPVTPVLFEREECC